MAITGREGQAILGRNRPSPEFPSLESPPKGVAIWSQCSKMAIRCHTLSIAVPVLKNFAFGLMTNLANPVSQPGPCKCLFIYFNGLEERRGNYSGFVPGTQHTAFVSVSVSAQGNYCYLLSGIEAFGRAS